MKEIFIGATPRSGTTMLASMIGSHSAVLTTPETQFKFQLSHLFSERGTSNDEIYAALMSNKRFRLWNFPVKKEDLDFSNLASFHRSICDQYAVFAGKKNYTHRVDSTPVNLRHAAFLTNVFGGCLFIHLVRDGRGVFASQRELDWGSNDPIFAALKWMEGICPGLLTEITYPDRCLRVHYENVLTDPARECKRICDFIGVDFEEHMITGADFKVPKYTQSQHQLVGQAPVQSRMDDWKQTLSAKEIRYFESMTYDLLDMLGYDRINKGIVPKPDELTQSKNMVLGAIKYLTINKWRNNRRFKRNTSA